MLEIQFGIYISLCHFNKLKLSIKCEVPERKLLTNVWLVELKLKAPMNIYDLNNISFSFINKHRERFDRFCRSWMIIIYCAITKARRAKTNHIYSAIKNTSQKYYTMKSTRGWRARTARFEPTCTLAIRIFVSFCFDMEMKRRIYC